MYDALIVVVVSLEIKKSAFVNKTHPELGRRRRQRPPLQATPIPRNARPAAPRRRPRGHRRLELPRILPLLPLRVLVKLPPAYVGLVAAVLLFNPPEGPLNAAQLYTNTVPWPLHSHNPSTQCTTYNTPLTINSSTCGAFYMDSSGKC